MKTLIILFSLLLVSSAMAKDMICINEQMEFGMKFDESLLNVSALEIATDTIANRGIRTDRIGNMI
jgi:hypothetical protein